MSDQSAKYAVMAVLEHLRVARRELQARLDEVMTDLHRVDAAIAALHPAIVVGQEQDEPVDRAGVERTVSRPFPLAGPSGERGLPTADGALNAGTRRSSVDVDGARALIGMPVVDARRLVEHEAELLCERRARRQPTGRPGRMHRCESCNRFMASRAGACGSCGFVQGRGWL